MTQPDLESARLLITELRRVTDTFAESLDAPPNDALEMSGVWFDTVEDLTGILSRARTLRNESFQASIRAAAQLPDAELQQARLMSAAVVNDWHAGRYPA
jgi:hypothetical protein